MGNLASHGCFTHVISELCELNGVFGSLWHVSVLKNMRGNGVVVC
jgi:hypothetical protein